MKERQGKTFTTFKFLSGSDDVGMEQFFEIGRSRSTRERSAKQIASKGSEKTKSIFVVIAYWTNGMRRVKKKERIYKTRNSMIEILGSGSPGVSINR